MARELHMKSSARDNFGDRGVQESQVSILGPEGYGPTMWVKSRRSGDILHGHDSKACQRVVARARDEENHFPAR